MKLHVSGHDSRYAVEQCLLVFFPDERPEFVEKIPKDGDYALSRLSRGPRFSTATTRIRLDGVVSRGAARAELTGITDPVLRERRLRYAVKLSFYRAACRATGAAPPWGALTGIRPAAIASRALEEGQTRAQVNRLLGRVHQVQYRQRALCLSAAESALIVKRSLSPQDVSLYVGIPFCPTRCSYCTFVSHSVEKAGRLLSDFLEALDREIRAAGELCRELGLRPVTLYVGGGTPTTLSEIQLEHLMHTLAAHFDLGALREYSVEAGRPDTLSPAKLRVLRANGAGRVSINPQSMQDTILKNIGRPHTAEDVRRAVGWAREAGFTNINTDLIAGLPGDTAQGFADSLREVLALSPANVTIHTLARKKGARMDFDSHPPAGPDSVGMMLEEAYGRLEALDYRCYYLYRQKFMAGQFENTGWAAPGAENLYNICMMEELHTVLALGGGGVTKLVDPARSRIERVFNPKYPYEYLSRFSDVLERKKRIIHFYENI